MTAAVALIANPASHAVAARGSVLQVAARQARAGAEVLWLRDFSALPERIAEMGRAGVGTIFVEGGDGTLEAVLSALLARRAAFRAMPALAVLPGGSTNLAHRVLGLRETGAQAVAARLAGLAAARPGESVRHPVMVVSGGGLPAPRAGFLLSTGAAARAMVYAQARLHGAGTRGAAAVAGMLLRVLLDPRGLRHIDGLPLVRPTPLDAHFGERRFAGGHLLTLLTPLPRLSLGLRPWWGREMAPLVALHGGWPVAALRRTLLRVIAGRGDARLEARGLHAIGCDSARLLGPGPVVLDGELLAVDPHAPLEIGLSEPLLFLR